MRYRVSHPAGEVVEEFSFDIHNRNDDDWWQGHRSLELIDLRLDIPLVSFLELSQDETQNLRRWLVDNAEAKVKAKAFDEQAERDEQDREETEARRARRLQPKPKVTKPGYVYLIHMNGYYKIGKSKNVEGRKSYFDILLPFEAELVHSFHSENYSVAEAALHEKYAELRVKGEWFSLTPEHLAEICAIQDDAI